jgi:hypothetical protein
MKVQTMAPRTFSQTVDDAVGQIETALAAIETSNGQALADLKAMLRQALLDFITLVVRDPGIETATADLYGAAAAVVDAYAAQSTPTLRMRRLLRDARTRFHERLARARPSEYGTKVVWRQEELLATA